MESKEIELGDFVHDKISDFRGTVTGIVQYITGCNQALVSPKLSADGAFRESHWFDLQRLEIEGKKSMTLDNGKTPGFDKAAPIR